MISCAKVIPLKDERSSSILRLENLKAINRPDLYVYTLLRIQVHQIL
jgi:hypothetical protein